MLTWHSFLQSVMFFVRSISVKVTKNHYRSSSVLMSGAVVIAVVAFSANGFGGGGKNAMAAPRTVDSLEADEEPETEALFEGSSFVTEAKIQFGLLNTGSEGQHLAGALLERDVRDRQRRQADAQIEIEALQKQILKEKEEAEARRKAEEERRNKVSNVQVGLVTEGVVESLQPYGAFVDLGNGLSGLVHISQICEKRIKKPSEVLAVGDKVKVKVTAVKDGKLSLSIKEATDMMAKEVEEEVIELPNSGEEATTSLGTLFANIKLD